MQNRAEILKPLCVFGVLDTDKGHEIAAEMLTWLRMVYDVTIIEHDGSRFEYPALRCAQALSMQTGRPVLYIHTRGAVNVWRTTIPTRRMWRKEFGKLWQKYFKAVEGDAPAVACPFADSDGETRYNGFVANAAAWGMLELKECADRMIYERLWQGRGVVKGLLIDTGKENRIKDIRKYLYDNFE